MTRLRAVGLFRADGRGSSQVQKAFNEVYRAFNAGQAPFVVADFIVPAGKNTVFTLCFTFLLYRVLCIHSWVFHL